MIDLGGIRIHNYTDQSNSCIPTVLTILASLYAYSNPFLYLTSLLCSMIG